MSIYLINSVRVILVLLALFSILLLSSCGEEKFKTTTTLKEFQASYAKQQGQESLKNKITIMPLLAEDDPAGGDYLLGAGDLLVIKVFEAKELDTEVRVSSRGLINVPLLGEVSVLNRTASEVEQDIETLYKKDYLHDPHVSVYIKEHMSKQITLVGEVEKPGTYEYIAQQRLLDVLAIANGLKDDAGPYAYITRYNTKTNKSVNYIIDLDDLVKNGNMAHNCIILGGDVVFIAKSGQCFVDGAVRKPGSYSLESNMTITEAIALAGGLAAYADEDSIKLIRFMGRGVQRQVVSLSYSDMQAGLGDTLLLKDQDLIFAESSASGMLFSGSGFSLGFMGTGVSYHDPEQYYH
jgi:polysaccharide export outer membrane protein